MRRQPLELQLTAMIDIFSMIVIFLIKGTVFGTTDVSIPEGLRLAQSMSKEALEIAPQLIITAQEVKSSVSSTILSTDSFKESALSDPKMEIFKSDLRGYLSKLSQDLKKSGILLNVIADRNLPYQKLFDVIKVFREVGFEVLLFVTTGPGGKS